MKCVAFTEGTHGSIVHCWAVCILGFLHIVGYIAEARQKAVEFWDMGSNSKEFHDPNLSIPSF